MCFVLNAQTDNSDNVEIVLICKKRVFGDTGIPLFNNSEYRKQYSVLKDTLFISIIADTDTMVQRKDTVLVIDYQKSKKGIAQILPIPVSFINIPIIVIGFQSKTFIFKKRICEKKLMYYQVTRLK